MEKYWEEQDLGKLSPLFCWCWTCFKSHSQKDLLVT